MVNIAVKVKDVKCGLDSTMFLTPTGTLLACGKYVLNSLNTATHVYLSICLSVHLSVCPSVKSISEVYLIFMFVVIDTINLA